MCLAATEAPAAATTLDPKKDQRSCDELVAYKQGPMNDEWLRVIRQGGFNGQRRHDLERIRAELLSDTYWATHPLVDLLAEVKVVADLFGEIPLPNGAVLHTLGDGATNAATAVEEAPKVVTSETILELIKGGGSALPFVQEQTAKAALRVATDIALEAAGDIAAPVRVLKSLNEYRKTKAEQQELKAVVQEQLENLERALAKVDAKQKATMATISTLKQIESAIDQACYGK